MHYRQQKELICQHASRSDLLLDHCTLTTEDVEYLCRERVNRVTERLWIMRNQIDSGGVRHISRVRWTLLRDINLWKNGVGDAGCRLLSRGCFPQLETLQLGTNRISHAGVGHLCKANWPKISKLYLHGNPIGREASLLRLSWGGLQLIDLKQCQIDTTGLTRLLLCRWTLIEEIRLFGNPLPAYDQDSVRRIFKGWNKNLLLAMHWLSTAPCRH